MSVNIVLVIYLRMNCHLVEKMVFNLWLRLIFFNYDIYIFSGRKISVSVLAHMLLTVGGIVKNVSVIGF